MAYCGAMQDFVSEFAKALNRKKNLDAHAVNCIKKELSKAFKIRRTPTNIEILCLLSKNDRKKLKILLLTKPTRSISGVAPVAVMTSPRNCPHGRCTMCPGGPGSYFGKIPQSYTGREPATMRGIRAGFDPYIQVMNRLEQYVVLGHSPQKLELIIMGGTFPSFPKSYKKSFVMYCYKAMNDFSDMFYSKNGILNFAAFNNFFELPGNVGDSERTKKIHAKIRKIKKKSLLIKEQMRNGHSHIKCIGMTIETRPDYAKKNHANEMLSLGCTRVELGVQSIYDSVLKKIKRGHTVEDSIIASQTLRDFGFKINYHYMIGLPGSTEKKDIEGLKELFSNESFKPDMLKIYPCMVIKGTKLYKSWKRNEFRPLTAAKAVAIIAKFKRFVPRYCRIMRVQRDIPTQISDAGPERNNLRQYVMQAMKQKGIVCNCIRCREIKNQPIEGKVNYEIIKYAAGRGLEYFISLVNKDKLIGFCRLRFPFQMLRKEITKDSAIVRELHVYGTAAAIGKKGNIQHRGFGKKLLKKAEDIAKKNKKKKMVIISGIGVRSYYRKFGYSLEDPYMVKKL